MSESTVNPSRPIMSLRFDSAPAGRPLWRPEAKAGPVDQIVVAMLGTVHVNCNWFSVVRKIIGVVLYFFLLAHSLASSKPVTSPRLTSKSKCPAEIQAVLPRIARIGNSVGKKPPACRKEYSPEARIGSSSTISSDSSSVCFFQKLLQALTSKRHLRWS